MNEIALQFIKAHTLTHERLLQLLRYEPETGNFRWRQSRGSIAQGHIAGSLRPDGYIDIRLDDRKFFAHRLAWFYMKALWPSKEMDHQNRCRSDNRWTNLREATSKQNQGNRPIQKNNSSGHPGVGRSGKKWRAYIKQNRKFVALGTFSTKEEAISAYRSAAIAHFGADYVGFQ